ncbi:hypothetical protein ACFQU7_01220 [Pseudoroseomonas wenyumeiae]
MPARMATRKVDWLNLVVAVLLMGAGWPSPASRSRKAHRRSGCCSGASACPAWSARRRCWPWGGCAGPAGRTGRRC